MIKDGTFGTFVPEVDVLGRVKAVTGQINTDLAGKESLFLVMLNGPLVFAASLVRYITVPDEMSFVKLASYQGIVSMGVIKEMIGLNEGITNRHMIIVEDIVDTEAMVRRMIEALGMRGLTPIDICTLLLRPGRLSVPLGIKCVAMEISNDSIAGYGLDHGQQGKGLRDVYTLVGE